MVITNDVEWPMLLYYVIYYENLKKIHAANREGSFNNIINDISHSETEQYEWRWKYVSLHNIIDKVLFWK